MEHCAQEIHFNMFLNFFLSVSLLFSEMSFLGQSLIHADQVKSSSLWCMRTVSDAEASTPGHHAQNHIAHWGLGLQRGRAIPGMRTPLESVLVLWHKDMFTCTAATWLILCSVRGCLLPRQKVKTSHFLFPDLLGQQRKASWFICSGIFHRKRWMCFSQDGCIQFVFLLGSGPGESHCPLTLTEPVLAHPSLRCRLLLLSAASPGFTCVLRLLLPLVAPVMNQSWVLCQHLSLI